MKRFLLLWLIFLYLNVPGYTQTPLGFAIIGKREKVEIPVEIYNNLIVVPVVLNGTLPLKFIVDTGVRTAILTQKSFSDILNLAYSRKFTITGPGGEKMIDAYVTNNVSLTLPGVQGKGHALLVLEQDYLELRNYLGTEVHGILGYELFSRFIVSVNYEKKIITLYSPARFRKPRGYRSVPITIEDTKPYIIAPIILPGGVKVNAKLLVDSGASHALLLDPLSDESIQPPEKNIKCSIGRGLGGEILGRAGRIDVIRLGDYQLRNVVANFPDPNSYSDTSAVKTHRNGTMGGEVLSRFNVIYDFSRERIYFKRNLNYKKAFHHNLSGLTIKSTGLKLNSFEVTRVNPGSNSDLAGLKPGDIISAVNGLPASTYTLNTLNALLNSTPGRKLKLEIQRKGLRMKKVFILEDQI